MASTTQEGHIVSTLPKEEASATTSSKKGKPAEASDPRYRSRNRQGTILHRQAKPACDSLGVGGRSRNQLILFVSGIGR
jgi:hypothetical protein